MPTLTAYATAADLKARLGRTDNVRDAELSDKLLTASRDVESDAGRPVGGFWLDTSPTQRIYNPRYRLVPSWDGQKVLIDDIGDATGLIVEVGSGANWATIDSTTYDTGPDNALALGKPITWLLRPYLPWVTWPRQRIRITAKFGWPAVPQAVKEATLLRAHRLYARRGSPEAVAGFADQGLIHVGRYDPDYDKLIASVKNDSGIG